MRRNLGPGTIPNPVAATANAAPKASMTTCATAVIHTKHGHGISSCHLAEGPVETIQWDDNKRADGFQCRDIGLWTR